MLGRSRKASLLGLDASLCKTHEQSKITLRERAACVVSWMGCLVVGWYVGWWVGGWVGWLVGWMGVWLLRSLIRWFVGWIICLVGLAICLVGGLVDSG